MAILHRTCRTIDFRISTFTRHADIQSYITVICLGIFGQANFFFFSILGVGQVFTKLSTASDHILAMFVSVHHFAKNRNNCLLPFSNEKLLALTI